MKRTILYLLIAAQLASLASCGGSETAPETTDAPTTTYSETTSYYDTLGDIPDFGGVDYTILSRSTVLWESYVEEETGEVVDDAVHRRNRIVSETLNVNIKSLDATGTWGDRQIFVDRVTNSIMAGDDEFQLILGCMSYMNGTIMSDLYTNIASLPNLNLENPWWYQGYNDNMTINGKLYSAMGDLCQSALSFAYTTYANDTLLVQYGYKKDDLYALVRDGKWTFDKLTAMAKTVTNDLDGNGVYDENDLYGLGAYYMSVRSMANAFGIDYVTKDDDGIPQLSVWGDRFVEVFETINEGCSSNWWFTESNSEMFSEDKLLFYMDYLSMAGNLRDMKSEFCVLPMPKFDEAQKNYRTEASDSSSVIFVPKTVQDTELAGYMLEFLNYESYNTVTPAYFETSMQIKVARDEDSREMMEIIRDSFNFNFGYCFSNAIGGWVMGALMQKAMDTPDAASTWASNEGAYETGLAKVVKYYMEG
ncbi:MAG: hypothetical protein E7632_00935 [Ruminococcaceae bacterium]|nr:hypothetical protein [Oscillospiraceae bacterium]